MRTVLKMAATLKEADILYCVQSMSTIECKNKVSESECDIMMNMVVQ